LNLIDHDGQVISFYEAVKCLGRRIGRDMSPIEQLEDQQQDSCFASLGATIKEVTRPEVTSFLNVRIDSQEREDGKLRIARKINEGITISDNVRKKVPIIFIIIIALGIPSNLPALTESLVFCDSA